ncbi:hypothetical protein QZH56_37095 (plasmid) [Streptomyces olivoreticuli]|uniref:hypothetical protein n=1 Tax=Streptomyces olivoreticuli TaxID=68246 RepID=UPI002659AF9B|nr:hypothetical protein [Streptomyces olivoreticuli]WKK27807.1 hypothetical protein QZH56_37095 [Streptomyces olivoreticuli]
MMKRGDELDAMPELAAAVEEACSEAPSEARERQIRAHARELVRGLRHPDHPLTTEAGLEGVLAEESLRVYERLAVAGELRARGELRPTSERTALVRSDVMVMLQRAAGLPAVHLRVREVLPLKTPVDHGRQGRFRASLETLSDYIGRRTHWTVEGGILARGYPRWVRMLALASVVLDTGARVGELCAMRLDDLSPGLEEVRVRRRPQGAGPAYQPPTEVFVLAAATRAALQRWLQVRRLLMREVTGAADYLWVSVRGNHGGVVEEDEEPEYRAAGTALQPRGVGRAYSAAVARVNIDLGGEVGWSPLPERMEQLRRGVKPAVVLVAPPVPDAEKAARLLHAVEVAGRDLAGLL